VCYINRTYRVLPTPCVLPVAGGDKGQLPLERRGSNSVTGTATTTADTFDLEAITASECSGLVRAASADAPTNARTFSFIAVRPTHGCWPTLW